MSAESKLVAARTSLVLEQPFFGSLALGLTLKNDPTCKTAWVNGRDLGYNPAFIDGLNHSQTVALLAHEVMHCALGHPWRRDGRDLKGFNIACDKAINGDLRDSFTLPDGVLYPEGEEVGKSAEWIFARMGEESGEDTPPQPTPDPEPDTDGDDSQGDDSGDSEGDTNDSDGEGDDNPSDGDTDGEGEGESDTDGDSDGDGTGEGDGEGNGTGNGTPDPLGELRDAPTSPDPDGTPAPTEQEWKQNAAQALQNAKAMGKVPGGMARLVKESMRPKIDVRALLLRFFQERSTGDYSWTRPSPRYLAQGVYLPALNDQSLGEIAIVNDTSMSRGDVAMSHARQIVQSVIDECNPLAVTVYHADAQVAQVDRVERGTPIVWNVKGGGGTNFIPALEAIEAEGTAVCAVYITDLKGVFPSVPPSFPVLWLSTEDTTAPFGETVYVEC